MTQQRKQQEKVTALGKKEQKRQQQEKQRLLEMMRRQGHQEQEECPLQEARQRGSQEATNQRESEKGHCKRGIGPPWGTWEVLMMLLLLVGLCPAVHSTSQWQTNMFYQWMNYSARQVTQDTCISCYNTNSRRSPEVRPLPFKPKDCTQDKVCGLYCILIVMAKGSWRDTAIHLRDSAKWDELGGQAAKMSECRENFPEVFAQIPDEIIGAPPVVKVPTNIEFPFCVTRHEVLEKEIGQYQWRLAESADDQRLSCREWDEQGNHVCSTTNIAPIRCKEVAINWGWTANRTSDNGTIMQASFNVPNLHEGTNPLADVFWYCGKGTQVTSTLKANWTGICARGR
ncbi:hypothetical protein MATL_G00175980 [Megalops atlanticus]|uniref:Uncharacterized protein n=1 Tax=Megalops atlanticus TaxID=7932 RepID=A0A9D3SZK1_MEGAT|nr:hypothetical protein MATL_G00175980 [Megalops atlanticus]